MKAGFGLCNQKKIIPLKNTLNEIKVTRRRIQLINGGRIRQFYFDGLVTFKVFSIDNLQILIEANLF